MLAIKPDREGDLTPTVLWTEKLAVPEVSSPLFYENRLYLIRNGGILSSLDADRERSSTGPGLARLAPTTRRRLRRTASSTSPPPRAR